MNFSSEAVRKQWLSVVKQLDNPKNTAENPFFKSKYAPLEDVLAMLKKEFAKEGFVIVQECIYVDGACKVRTEFHNDEGSAISEWAGTENKKDPQATGSSITYMRRYQILAVCGLVGEKDDDANMGSGKIDKTVEKINGCKDVKALNALWKTLSEEERDKYLPTFQNKKSEIGG